MFNESNRALSWNSMPILLRISNNSRSRMRLMSRPKTYTVPASGNPHRLVSPWTPVDPVWQGTIDGHLVAMQVRPIANGFRLAHQGFEVAVHVFTDAEAAAARLMPVATAA